MTQSSCLRPTVPEMPNKNKNNFQFLPFPFKQETYSNSVVMCVILQLCRKEYFSSLYKDITDAIRGYYIVICIRGIELILNLPPGTQARRHQKRKWHHSEHLSPFNPSGPHYIWGKVFAKVKCRMGCKLSWGVVGKGRRLASEVASSQGLSEVLILHALLISDTVRIGWEV